MTNDYTLLGKEEEASGAPRQPKRQRTLHYLKALVIFAIWSSFFLAFLSLKKKKHAPRNVILMVSDGFGPASETFARQYHAWKDGLPMDSVFPLDKIIVGQSRTQSSSSLITDSAAGATVFACGLKTFNGAIGVDPDKTPCGTILESAKIHHHMKTGLVVKSRVTHATPASFSAHVNWRDWENTIAEQQIGHNPLGRTLDLMFGGGLCEFLSNQTEGSCRQDDRNLLKEAQEQFGWHLITKKEQLDQLQNKKVTLPLMGLFASHHMDYALDRDPDVQPSLVEMTNKALDILKDSKQGFFLMIEGSRIDMAAHVNDPAAHYHEILEYQQTVAAVTEFVSRQPNTILISVSDHETGGLTVGRQVTDDYPEYAWSPEVIERANNSTEQLSLAWAKAVQDKADTPEFLQIVLEHGLGIQDTTKEEFDRLWDWKDSDKGPEYFALILSDILSTRAQIGWTTMGHTAVDVNLYAYGHQADQLRGNQENTDIGKFIVNYLKLDLKDITKKLNR
ncbi:Alkaline phosphatase [Choanephora cucurbitarum]|uniref:Alkaline phosphatase n=1 Tax=Choanephora cucurbitarum TaxID=101091 RepID=A0A1C7N6W0_9FUNG|nr:Alkaline phosphatase [Choanephora cucurbitarum]